MKISQRAKVKDIWTFFVISIWLPRRINWPETLSDYQTQQPGGLGRKSPINLLNNSADFFQKGLTKYFEF